METLLLIVTLISIAMAIVAFISAYRVRRHERERSEARVAALAAAADTHGSTDGGWVQIGGEWQWNPAVADAYASGFGDQGLGISSAGTRDQGFGISSATGVSRSSREARPAPIPNPQTLITDSAPQVSSGAFFGTVQREETSGNRLPIFVAAALIVLLGGALIFLNTSASNEHASTVAEVERSEPLELVALGHARETSGLTITGTIRNPATSIKLEGLTAVISLLDRNGALVSTKDVPLDYRAIAPGEEAPFKVTIPESASVARYRVSFRAGTAVVPHVDRRVDTKLASAVQ
jgi:hypothetical protein